MKIAIVIILLFSNFKVTAQEGHILSLNGKMFEIISRGPLASYDSIVYNKTGDTAYLYRHQEEEIPVLLQPDNSLFTVKFYLKGRFIFSFRSNEISIENEAIHTGHYQRKTFKYDKTIVIMNQNNLFKLK